MMLNNTFNMNENDTYDTVTQHTLPSSAQVKLISNDTCLCFREYPCVITSQILLRKVLDPPKPLF